MKFWENFENKQVRLSKKWLMENKWNSNAHLDEEIIWYPAGTALESLKGSGGPTYWELIVVSI